MQAIMAYEKALSVRVASDSSFSVARTKSNLVNVYVLMGISEEELNILQKALEICKEILPIFVKNGASHHITETKGRIKYITGIINDRVDTSHS